VSDVDEALADVKSTAKQLLRGRLGELNGGQMANLLRHAPLVARQALRYALEHRSYHLPGAEIRLRVHCEQEPLSSSRITLSTERDSLNHVRASLEWRVSELELRTIQLFVETARGSLASLAEVVPHPDLADADRFRAQCQDGYHHMGGMRMDASPRRGVVTPDLQLHNTENVFVCSGAVFPTSGFSNPTHTLLALAMRLAAHVSAQA
jgi:choline dehydrogenase-like flavoprotein